MVTCPLFNRPQAISFLCAATTASALEQVTRAGGGKEDNLGRVPVTKNIVIYLSCLNSLVVCLFVYPVSIITIGQRFPTFFSRGPPNTSQQSARFHGPLSYLFGCGPLKVCKFGTTAMEE